MKLIKVMEFGTPMEKVFSEVVKPWIGNGENM